MVKSLKNTNHLPEAVIPGVETAALAVLGTFVEKYGPSVGQAIYQRWKGKEVLFVQIEAAWKEGNFYYIGLSFSNLAEHGVYLEDIGVKAPKDTPLEIRISKPTGIEFGETAGTQWAAAHKVLPVLLRTDINVPQKLLLRVPELSGYKTLTLEYEFSQLDEAESKKKALVVRIRKTTGPALLVKNA